MNIHSLFMFHQLVCRNIVFLVFLLNYFIEPLTVHGDGNYPLSLVKEIKVTDTFLGLEQRFKKCQTKESLGECTSALLLNKSIEMCGCVPFGLKTLTEGNQESFKLFFLFINTLNCSQFVTM